MTSAPKSKPVGMDFQPITSKQEMNEAVYAFRRSRIILTAFELGLFSALAERWLSAESCARIIGADARATDRLLNALCGLGLVRKKRGQFANARIARALLVSSAPGYMAGLSHSANQWQSWHTLTEAVRYGGTVIEKKTGSGNKKRLAGFIAAMHERASRQAPHIVKRLDLTAVRRCLDIGGGSGAYAIALARAKKSLRVNVFDLPEVLPLTREYVRQAGLQARIEFAPGDFHHGNWGTGYDLVLLSAIVHMNSPKENQRLIARAARSLNGGGQLVIQDFIMGPDRTKPAVGAFFALNMLVATAKGDTFTTSEVRGWMRSAGLIKIVHKSTPFDASLMIGGKP